LSVTEQLLKNNDDYAATFDKGALPMPPAKQTAVLACMDARLNIYGMLGLEEGDVHVIRNAGGVATDDAIRSLTISQRLLGTKEIILIHHTDCGLLTLSDDALARQIQDEIGLKPRLAMESLPDLDEDVKQSIARIKTSPFIPHTDQVRGFVYEVETGKLREVV
jgi:carbonic anhydrase